MSKITAKVNYKEVLKGDTGYTFEPHVTVDGVLYWSNNGDLPNPLPVNIKGKSGDMAQEEEINNINKSIKEINNKIEQLDEPYHLKVGENQHYRTIKSAFNEWLNPNTINKKPTIITILKGVYEESISYYGQCNITFIGEDRQNVIWKTTTGNYNDAPLNVQGEVLIKNITFIADHSKNTDYDFSQKNTGAYALHIDQKGVVGKTIIKNCTLISEQNAAIGCGTRSNQTIEIIDCDLYNKSNKSNVKGVSNGALLYHTSADNDDSVNQKIILNNVKLYSESGRCLELQTYGSNEEIIKLESINVNCYSNNNNLKNHELVRFVPQPTTNIIRIKLTENSCNCNVESLNNKDSSYQKAKITNAFGDAILVNDFNNVLNFSFFKGNGNTGCLNTPTPHWYIALNLPYEINSNMDNNTFVIQYAWNIQNNFKLYKRFKQLNDFTEWVVCSENNNLNYVIDNEVIDCNEVKTNKFKVNKSTGGLNCPKDSSGWFIGEQISFSDKTFILQKIYAIQDSFKEYRRYKQTDEWSEWILIK